MGIPLFYAYLTLLEFRQLDRCVVLPFLDIVPDKLICHPRGLFLGKLNVLTSRIVEDGKPLAAFAADNGFHKDCSRGMLRQVPQASGNAIRIHQRGPRQGATARKVCRQMYASAGIATIARRNHANTARGPLLKAVPGCSNSRSTPTLRDDGCFGRAARLVSGNPKAIGCTIPGKI